MVLFLGAMVMMRAPLEESLERDLVPLEVTKAARERAPTSTGRGKEQNDRCVK